MFSFSCGINSLGADASGRAVLGEDMRAIACWNYGFEFRRGMDVCLLCCVLSGRGLCDGYIPHSDESYRLRYVTVCDPETSRMRWPWPALGTKEINIYLYNSTK
jgi:hypothetical protein